MLRFEDFYSYVKISVIGVFVVYSVCAGAQTDDEITPSVDDFGEKVTFTILNEMERYAYQQEREKTLKEKLASSQLAAEHQDLIAKAVSKFYGGVPVSSYSEQSVNKSSREKELVERFKSVSILDNGFVAVEGSEETPLGWFETPFNHVLIPLSFWDHSSGKVVAKKNSEITFRFDQPFVAPREGEEFGEAYDTISEFLSGMELVAEITIDQDSGTVLRYSEHLLRSFRKMFIFRVRKLNNAKDYQFIEECGCMVVTREVSELLASAIVAGRYDERITTKYSDMKFQKPLRFVLPDLEHHDL